MSGTGVGTAPAPEGQAVKTGPTGEPALQAAAWKAAARLPCVLAVALPLASVRLAEVLALVPGAVLATPWLVTADVPLRVNGELVAWCEFEVVRGRIAVRLTELA
jgi:flagellar motor switch/type III secretory pathway protein FliN